MASEDRNTEDITQAGCTDCTPRERSFDELTRGLADGSLSRRKALRLFGGALVGSVLASIPGVALAAPPPGTCLQEGKVCKTNTQCCSQNCETRKGKRVCGPAVQCTGEGQGNCPQPADQCLEVRCNSGFCGAVQNKQDGSGCNAGNACTVNDTCQAGVCTPGGARNCDDNDVCTVDTCDPATGCVHTPIPGCCRNNAECDDDNACTTDTCEGNIAAGEGVCVNTPVVCDDNDVCTVDTCDPATGCVHTPIPGCCRNNAECDDDNACTTDTCEGNIAAGEGVCVNTPVVCDDDDVCTVDTCDPDTGCVHTEIPGCCRNNAECDDGNACTTNTCEGDIAAGEGVCVSTPVVCNDNNVCTVDTCDPDTGCVHTPIPGCCRNNAECNDNNVCTTDTCENNVCVFTPVANCCTTNAQCNDNNVCTTDTCVANQCVFTPITGCCTTDAQCNDSNACTTDTCNQLTNTCVNTPTNQGGRCAGNQSNPRRCCNGICCRNTGICNAVTGVCPA
jgi:hypothetical protein